MPSPIFRIPSNADHERVSALFLGPKAENTPLLQNFFNLIVAKQQQGRLDYYPDDPAFITQDIQASTAFEDKSNEFKGALEELLVELNKYSIPFYSPRYSAHMCVDQSLPAILGYLSTMFYNPNNVAFEASPFTTQLEILAGQQMCQMLGYNINVSDTALPAPWGHITCDGTVANLESVWVSRNLKFYPLSLRDAMAGDGPLAFISDTFDVNTCLGQTKLLRDCTVWELLNLEVETIVEIPERLYREYRISSQYLEAAMSNYLIQTISKDEIMKKWGIEQQPVIFVPATKHYSWPKDAAIAGVGSGNAINVPIDRDARMDTSALRTLLEKCLAEERAVLEVVAVMGTTEEGAVDRLEEVVEIRKEMQSRGLSFVLHADAAWGGYFTSMLPREPDGTIPGAPRLPSDFVPQVGLRAETADQLRALKYTDSITIDPHKAGYVPYPAGGLCYRDGRMRYLVTWTAPYVNQGVSEGESIGVYGVEGSKPGAAAAAVYLHHQVVGLTPEGHGALLGEAAFTCRRYSSHWATMSTDKTDFIVVPLNPIPAERDPDANPADIEAQKEFIRTRIIAVDNADLVEDDEAMKLLNQLGSDLNINAFAVNFRYADGRVNEDIEEANWLNRRIFERLSVTSPEEDPLSIPFYLTSTIFAQSDYGVCNDEFKKRLGLKGNQDLFVLRNVVMSPFSTTHDFVAKMAAIFRTVVEEEVENVRNRNIEKPGQHTFLVQGTDTLFFVHLPTFHMASGRQQFIFSADLSSQDLPEYKRAVASSKAAVLLRNTQPMLLNDIADGATFSAEIFLNVDNAPEALTAEVSNVKVVKRRSLDTEDLESTYPTLMPFYLYGTPEQAHIDHMLLFAPNIQLSAGVVGVELSPPLTAAQLAEGAIAVAQNIHEASMQPFPDMAHLDLDDPDFFFSEGKQLVVKVYKDPFPKSTSDPIPLEEVTELLASGRLTLQKQIFVDSDRLDSEIGGTSASSFDSTGKMANDKKKAWVKAVGDFHDRITL